VEKLSKTDDLVALGADTSYKYEGADVKLLERFENPMRIVAKQSNVGARAHTSIRIVSPEFTSLCPLTGQPDFATIK